MAGAYHSLDCMHKSDRGIVVITIYVDDLIVRDDSEGDVEYAKEFSNKNLR